MTAWNIFRYAGDLCHIFAKTVLILAIHGNKSAEGVSLITQGLYATVFITRYLNLYKEHSAWNFIFKTIYIGTSIYTIAIMQWKYPRTRERELAWKIGCIAVAASLVASPFFMLMFEKHWTFLSWLWTFSEILESVAVLPQLLLLRQTTVPTVIDSYYLVALGSYRGFYVLNWLVRALDKTDSGPDAVSVIFGVIQTALYIDFAWVYYTRQRVKLRHGGIVDADDMRRGWLVNRVFGKQADREDLDEEQGNFEGQGSSSRARPNWGTRGVSVSAEDDEFNDADDDHEEGIGGRVDPDAKMQDPDDLAKVLDDDDDEDTPLQSGQGSSSMAPGVRSGDEWRD